MAKMKVKDIKRDEVEVAVADATGRVRDFASRKRKELGIVIGVLAIAGGAFAAARWWIHHQESEAQTAYAAVAKEANNILVLPIPEPGRTYSEKTWPEIAAEFQAIADAHPRTVAGRLASFQAGVARFKAGDAKAAAAALAAHVEKHPDDWTTPHALAAQAAALEHDGDLAGAEAALQKLQSREWTGYPAGVAMQVMAEFLERNGRRDEAAKAWATLAEDPRFAETRAQQAAQAKAKRL